jgi:hypothetical protein
MIMNYVTGKDGKRYQLKTSVDFGAVLTTSILPELRPIDSMCIAPDGLIFSKWRDPEYRGSDVVDDNRMVAFVEAYNNHLLLPNIDKIYGYIHPNNIASAKWVLSRGGYVDGKYEDGGVIYDRFIVPIDVMVKRAEAIKEKCLTKA